MPRRRSRLIPPSFSFVAIVAFVALHGCGNDAAEHAPDSVPNDGDSIYLAVMPPGSNGNSAGGLGLPGTDPIVYPRNFADALPLYGDLAYAPPGLESEPCQPPRSSDEHQKGSPLACNYYKHAGLEPDVVASDEVLTAPNGSSVRIRRDAWGVPFIDAEDRAAAMYGVGYAGAADRLWLYDVLRHIGRGRFSEFLGPAADTYGFDSDYAALAGYDEAELGAMLAGMRAKFGALGSIVLDDMQQLVAGLNAYVDHLLTPAGLGEIPPEYSTLALSPGSSLRFPPAPFVPEDVVASAVLIQSLFATGGGREHMSTLLLQHLDPSFGAEATTVPEAACRFWRDVRHALDPDTPHTLEELFSTQSPAVIDETCPQTLPAGAAIWDPESFRRFTTFAPETSAIPLPLPSPSTLTGILGPERPLSRLTPVVELDPVAGARRALARAGLPIPAQLSNFVAVTADQTQTGHPIAVMGPQTAYFVPQLLWEVAINSNGGSALDFAGRGVVFGNLPYINIGRGLDFAFSATSGNSDLVDVRVSRLCNLDGLPASREDADADGFPDATGYLVDAMDGGGTACRPLFRRVDEWVAQPSAASVALGGPVIPETVRRYVLRTHYGPVFATATVRGEPVAISRQRSTFLAEVDTAIPFALATTRAVRSASDFQRLFNAVTGSFNWLYVDRDDVGYLHSGLYPERAAAIHPELPSWGDGRFEWAVDQLRLDAAFFAEHGGDRPFPNRALPLARGDELAGYVEWPGYLPLSAHPQAVNPPKGDIASWNNAPARGFWAADFQASYGPIHRAQLLEARLAAYRNTGRRHDIASLIELASDAAFADLRGQELLPLLLRLVQGGPLSDEQLQVVELMQEWLDAGSLLWMSGAPGLGAFRRDRDDSGTYDQRAAVLLMDAWYPRLIERVLPELVAAEEWVGQERYDAPRAQGSAFQEGWFQHLARLLQMALGETATPYRELRCADGTASGCRAQVLEALALALADLGGLENRDDWTGSPLAPAGGQPVEEYDAVQHRSFSLLGVPPIPWTNRPTFQEAVEIRTRRASRAP
jgi:acyl-homoserine lactone acylase PvdQ